MGKIKDYYYHSQLLELFFYIHGKINTKKGCATAHPSEFTGENINQEIFAQSLITSRKPSYHLRCKYPFLVRSHH